MGDKVDNFAEAVELAMNKEVEQYEKEKIEWEKNNKEYFERNKANSEHLLKMLLKML